MPLITCRKDDLARDAAYVHIERSGDPLLSEAAANGPSPEVDLVKPGFLSVARSPDSPNGLFAIIRPDRRPIRLGDENTEIMTREVAR
jgi:hypothetical protein